MIIPNLHLKNQQYVNDHNLNTKVLCQRHVSNIEVFKSQHFNDLSMDKNWLPTLTENQGSKYRISGSYRMGGFSHRISGEISGIRAHFSVHIGHYIYEILITKSWFRVIHIIHLIKWCNMLVKTVKNNVHLHAVMQ